MCLKVIHIKTSLKIGISNETTENIIAKYSKHYTESSITQTPVIISVLQQLNQNRMLKDDVW
jgi:hypothetical protein